jgi:hypothetical protein
MKSDGSPLSRNNAEKPHAKVAKVAKAEEEAGFLDPSFYSLFSVGWSGFKSHLLPISFADFADFA